MPAERYFHENLPPSGNSLLLEEHEFHHLANVMRQEIGEEVELVNGRGLLARARIDRIEKKRAVLTVLEMLYTLPPSFSIILAQAIPRLQRLEFIVEKGTELGMSELQLFPASLSEKKTLSDHQMTRLRAIMIAAMKQCGRLYLPQIVIKPSIAEWGKPELPAYFGDFHPTSPLFEKAWEQHPASANGILFVIGPESGFNDHEINLLRQLGIQGVKLHHNVLRTETAALAALALISHWVIKSS
jgi:16S rRNA (uracil1498-N3)-methyltransferase